MPSTSSEILPMKFLNVKSSTEQLEFQISEHSKGYFGHFTVADFQNFVFFK